MKITDLPDFLELFPTDVKEKKISKVDFLESLLKNIDDIKSIKEIINHSNIKPEQKNKLLQKFLIKLEKKPLSYEIKPLIPKTIFKDKKINENKIDENKTNFSKNSLLISLIQNSQNQQEIIKKIKQIPKKQPQIVTEIKFLLNNFKNPHIQKIIATKKFKEAKNIKDIINLSKEYKLNLIKIAISQIKNKSFKKNKNTNSKIPKNDLLTFVIKQKLTTTKTFTKKLTLTKPNHLEKQIPKKHFNISDLLNKPLKETKNHKLIKTPQQIKTSKHNLDITDLLNKKTDKLKTKKNKTTNSIINNSIQNIPIKHQIITAKQTLKHFVSSLKEAVENYKPPVSKLTLELHPKELGKVEVTIKQRGENLNIQINTNNTSTINFFTTSQQELKNSLVNMGFTNINMNFNSNQNQQKQNQNQQKYLKNNQKKEDEELIIDFSYKYA